MEQKEKFEHWGIVDLFGHQRMAGKISEDTVGGCQFVRVDIPDSEGFHTHLFGQGAIYGIHITDEATARATAKAHTYKPVSPFELPELRQAQLSYRDEEEEFADDIPI